MRTPLRTPLSHGSARWWAGSALLVLSACIPAPRPGAPAALAPDTALFAAVVGSIAGGALQVDPRPLDFVESRPLSSDLLAQVDPAVVEARGRALRLLGLGTTDALGHARCALQFGGARVPGREPPRGCPDRPFQIAILTLPRRGGAGEISSEGEDVWTTRVYEYGGHAASVYDVVARWERRTRSWAILGRVFVGGVVA